jgi:hypothetical protein
MSGAERRQHSTNRSLLMSLARYIQSGDTKIPYEIFLRKVIDRIVDELSNTLDPGDAGKRR